MDDHLTDNPVLNALRAEPLSSRVNSGLTTPSMSQATADVATPPMAPGVGGFNIDPPALRARPKLAHLNSSCAYPTGTSIAKMLDHLIGNPVLNASRAQYLLSSGVNPGLTASSTFQAVADVATPPMAPGIGGFNIDPPAPRAEPKLANPNSTCGRPTGASMAQTLGVPSDSAARPKRGQAAEISQCQRSPVWAPSLSDVAFQGMRGHYRSLPEPTLIRRPPIRRWKAVILSTGDASAVFNLVGVTAIVTVMLLAFADEARKPEGGISSVMLPLRQVSNSLRSDVARLVVEDQKGFTNEPLPLGISLKDASDGEIVTVAGLAEGTELSLGTSKGLAGWVVSARDLDKTFVGAREQFVGTMDATVNLQSASGQLVDSQVIRFEWIERR